MYAPTHVCTEGQTDMKSEMVISIFQKSHNFFFLFYKHIKFSQQSNKIEKILDMKLELPGGMTMRVLFDDSSHSQAKYRDSFRNRKLLL